MVPVVVIEVAAPTPRPEFFASLADACNRAVLVGQCVLAGPDAPGEPDAVAIVSWRDRDDLHARVQVGIRRDERWLEQALDFEPTSAEPERWRTVGLTIASLIGELPNTGFRVAGTASDETPEAPADTPAPAPAAPAPEPQRKAASRPSSRPARREPPLPRQPAPVPNSFVAAEVGAESGPGLSEGPWRAGIYARAGWHARPLPLAVEIRGDYARPMGSPEVVPQWWTVQVGPCFDFAVAPFRVELGGAFVYEVIRFSAQSSDTGRTDHAAVSFGSLALRAGALSPAEGHLSVHFGLSAFPSSVFDVHNQGEAVGKTVPLTVLGEVGVVLRLP